MKYYLDTEFDGHNGPLISLALVSEDSSPNFYYVTYHSGNDIKDPWVRENVDTIVMHYPMNVRCTMHIAHSGYLPDALDAYLANETDPVFIADSPVDIARLSKIMSTNPDGSWRSSGFNSITFEVHNVDCYPSTLEDAVQHNAYWDALALQVKLAEIQRG